MCQLVVDVLAVAVVVTALSCLCFCAGVMGRTFLRIADTLARYKPRKY